MLKALELIGFKSFAERTRFEFPPGITVVVGPNGSGKSNIVDAIRWVLGEQSAKSLRGKEMADVIFNGSGTRRALNSAEITLTLDNASRLLAVDSAEVHITRRVYRSGEGEYLLNRQPCRLRDIRDLLAGTGIAIEAYSIIEQGKVDVLLQSSAKDRRIIFEEAAGISRFKAKKIEALRRLERVEQNLLRLSDIIDEVESRLRSVRAQAAKARRYREYTQRLQELRTQVGLADWRQLTGEIEAVEAEIESLHRDAAEQRAEAEAIEAAALEAETQAARIEQALHDGELAIAGRRERIAALEALIVQERSRIRELDDHAGRSRKQLATMTARAGDVAQQLAETEVEVAAAETQYRQLGRRLADDQRELTELTARFDRARTEEESCRSAHLEVMRRTTACHSRIAGLEAHVADAESDCRRAAERLEQIERLAAQLAAELVSAQGREAECAAAEQLAQSRRQQAAAAVEDRQRELAQAQQQRADVETRLTAAEQRAAVLQELQQRQEGVSAGVKQVLAEAAHDPDGPYGRLHALVADLLNVRVEHAPLIDAALGELAGFLVVDSRRTLAERLAAEPYRLAGRVGFVELDAPRPSAGARGSDDFTGQPGVLGRASGFVETQPQYQLLLERLLGDVWIVKTLADAVRLAGACRLPARFVTLAAEVACADGTVVVGPRQAAAGLIWRRSELRSLEEQIGNLRRDQAELQATVADRQQALVQAEARAKSLDGTLQQAVAALAEQRAVLQALRQRASHLDDQQAAFAAEQQAAAARLANASAELDDQRQLQAGVEAELAAAQRRLDDNQAQLHALEEHRQSQHRRTALAQVDLAKAEQRLEHLRMQLRQFEQHRQERDRAIADVREQISSAEQRQLESQRAILRAESELADLYLRKEALVRQVARYFDERDQVRARRAELVAQAQSRRNRIRKLDEKIHTRQLSASDLRTRRAALADRLREDYNVELSQLEHQPTAEELHQREAVEQEIAELRQKLAGMGGVNLDALAELDELETRCASLSAQHKDLSTAKASLIDIIERINADSRRLFVETLQTVRGHFQQLFRKLFGGGQADVMVEEDADVLEGGIDIIARPPGKEPRSISLLSGGEKTLTCVALLLAIFRSKPSPFCVLDEVDAALDEANIERFIGVLNEFLAWTQFIVVTHSKKTMTAAGTLYGVTMQESGISKRVSVRFEDVSEDGRISQAALARAEAEEAA